MSALLVQVAHAQTPANRADPTAESTTDIIVTAQRKSESLQNTPIAVTAVTADTVQTLGLTRAVDVASITPGANFTTAQGFFAPHIRGIGSDFVSVGIETPVAIYEDGAYLTRTLSVNEIVDNFDIGSIQVLRGPQGTLYGRNATGGVIIINSADPTDKFEARVRGEWGNLEHRSLSGMLNMPLGEDLALRVTGGYKHDGGFVRNLNTGDKNAGGSRTYNVRGKLRWQPGNADIILGAQFYDTKAYLGSIAALERRDDTCLACNLAPGALKPNVGYYDTEGITTIQPLRTKYYGANLNMAFDMGSFTLSSITTFRQQKTADSASDQDLTPLPLFEFSVPRSGGKSYTQDLQVSSTLDGRFNYLFGLSYLYDKGYFNPAFLGNFFGGSFDPDTAAGFKNTATTQSYAAFLEGYYDLTDQLKVTVGGRYTYEERSGTGETNAALAAAFGIPNAFSFKLRTSQRAFTPRFVLAWDNGPTNVYYSFTRGFKAGGFPGPYAAPVAPVQPEKIFSHEIGIKQSMADNRIRVNAAIFYAKNKNQQVQTLDLNSGGTLTGNAGAMENYGVEVEAQFTPLDGFNLGLTGAWQHARYESFPNASLVCYDPTLNTPAAPAATIFPCAIDLSGTKPPFAPTWSGSANASYNFAIGSWTAQLSGLATYRSAIDFLPGAGGELRADRDNKLIVVNASGYISPPGENLRVGFFANNVFDKKYPSYVQTGQPYGVYKNVARPRTYGLRVEYIF
ncbi:TonB-dependent receptor [Sphingobium sp. 3R8]|uniref:TonB-dependent receptor n=1 Tax=Sphingobium sp. 3R8 TaxID=2874921 RepID=UPI001CCB13B7|nr:TonB-dependent receptor [Sphingobium sp. 3R8]MBZ9646608.1 TonB-dependent receptor [Sphingobium sp. 3R8]